MEAYILVTCGIVVGAIILYFLRCFFLVALMLAVGYTPVTQAQIFGEAQTNIVADSSVNLRAKYGYRTLEYFNPTGATDDFGGGLKFPPGVTKVSITPQLVEAWNAAVGAGDFGSIDLEHDFIVQGHWDFDNAFIAVEDRDWKFDASPGTYFYNGLKWSVVAGLVGLVALMLKRVIGGTGETTD